MAIFPGAKKPCSWRSSTMARASARLNQRQSSSSASSLISRDSARAKQPNIRVVGKGQGCDAL